VNETGGGIDVVDLAEVDEGIVRLVQRSTVSGVRTVHNIFINEASETLYLAGSNLNGGTLIALDLADPENPVLAGLYRNGPYVHDLQVVTYEDGPFAGREIAFCFAGETGVDIVDVTDRSNMVRLSRSTYPRLAYAHQGWISADRRYLYVNDELDELFFFHDTRTRVFDATDLANPVYLGFFYIRDGFMYQANYRSGLWVLDLSDPENGVVTGHWDTYERNDLPFFNGAWSVYPYFPSGIVVVSDIEDGLYLFNVNEAIGDRLDLATPDLVAGTEGPLEADGAAPGGTVYFIYGTSAGSSPIPPLGVTAGVANPMLVGSAVADGTGAATFTGPVPAASEGAIVRLQALESLRTSPVVTTTIR